MSASGTWRRSRSRRAVWVSWKRVSFCQSVSSPSRPTYLIPNTLPKQKATSSRTGTRRQYSTGAGPGIMSAANEGAGQESSFGVNIVLPFEAKPNPFIASDPKLINFKYFFTRKLMFMKEAEAFVLFPGGFGTLDELFELLTLSQTGKSDLHPIVMIEAAGDGYWAEIDRTLKAGLLTRGYVDPEDLGLYHLTESLDDAVDYIKRFYRVYHSQRYVDGKLILRLNTAISDAKVARLSEEFADIMR